MRNLFEVSGKTVLVTGGGRGLGAMIARGFVANGASVYVASRDAAACEATASELSKEGCCRPLPCDLSNVAGIRALAAAFGARESQLDVLVNNAGTNWREPLETFSEAGWDEVQDVNLKAPFFLIQAMLPRLRAAVKASGAARVINVASMNGLRRRRRRPTPTPLRKPA